MVAKHLKKHVSGWVIAALTIASLVVTAILIRIDASAATINAVLAWTALAVVIAVFWLTAVAQYDAWKEEREAREHAEAELAKAADIQGISRISISPTNPYADQTRPGSWFRCECDCTNVGNRECEITEIWAWITPAPRKTDSGVIQPHKRASYDPIPAQVVLPGRAFRYNIDLIADILPEELRVAEVKIVLKDSLKNEYQIDTRISPRFLEAAP